MNPWVALYYAQQKDCANFDELERAVIESKSANVAIKWGERFPDSDIFALQDIVLSNGNAWHYFEFAKRVNGANIDALEMAVIKESGRHPFALLAFAEQIEGCHFYKIKKVVDNMDDSPLNLLLKKRFYGLGEQRARGFEGHKFA